MHNTALAPICALRGPRGAMIDWTAVMATLPDHFTLDTMIADKTAVEKTRAHLRQVVVRWSNEDRVRRTGRGMYQKPIHDCTI